MHIFRSRDDERVEQQASSAARLKKSIQIKLQCLTGAHICVLTWILTQGQCSDANKATSHKGKARELKANKKDFQHSPSSDMSMARPNSYLFRHWGHAPTLKYVLEAKD